jgi:S-DNA-T family DNA segregation ATPase FtsK/SpoIIIE
MARQRRAGRSSGGRRGSGPSLRWTVSPDVTRSLVGIVLLILGAVTLIALALPGEGTLTNWWRDTFAPWFGSGRWLLPFALIAAGIYVERAKGPGTGWVQTLLGLSLTFVAALGLIDLLVQAGLLEGRSGGRIGSALASVLSSLLSSAGAFVVLVGAAVSGILIAFNVTPAAVVGAGRRAASRLGASMAASSSAPSSAKAGQQTTPKAQVGPTAAGRGAAIPGSRSPVEGQAGIWGPDGAATRSAPVPTSATFAPAATAQPGGAAPGLGAAGAVGAAGVATVVGGASAVGLAVSGTVVPDDVTDAGDAAPTPEEPPYELPPVTLLDEGTTRTPTGEMDHAQNAQIIEAKLASFNIPATVVRWNAGPVVTQYEVRPDPSIKVSRIEALSDDLAMALAARTIRVEAPIPGKDVVGVEIPNTDFNVVTLRRILEEVDFGASGSKLTFALGRDVAGHARAVDLAKMPHLLIAGATGSGKSVMVNALITSLLMEATPDEVRLILMDLKRVELASYNELPHLLVPVITEPAQAKAALKWAVAEMEYRYKRFAGATARNITAYNETRVKAEDRLPYIVIIVDELADLMMREGKAVEDPIVRLAQKARATGIHMVLATQRPSVNVVTGLIKANFPSRIAFAMASQIDSRTILDAPGAEDLIGRGDMLYQPADLPRPVRLQGVFVADREIGKVTEFWRSWDHHYDLAIVDTGDEGESTADDLADEDADRLLPDAISVIREYDRASASLLQRRLKVGYARAARMIDQLEARGYVGPFDGSNARQVLRREEPLGGRAGGETGLDIEDDD